MALKVTWKKYQELPDDVLLDKFRETGDLEILGKLYERYMHLVYGVCMKYFENRDEARDGVMDIFEKLITDVPRHEIANFKSWLYVLAKNFCLMKIRSDKTESARKEKWQNEQELFMESGGEMHPVDEEEQSLNKSLLECIEELKELQQQCIRLFYMENRSYREICSTLGLDEKKVKSYIQNGKRNLKICIEKKDGKRK